MSDVAWEFPALEQGNPEEVSKGIAASLTLAAKELRAAAERLEEAGASREAQAVAGTLRYERAGQLDGLAGQARDLAAVLAAEEVQYRQGLVLDTERLLEQTYDAAISAQEGRGSLSDAEDTLTRLVDSITAHERFAEHSFVVRTAITNDLASGAARATGHVATVRDFLDARDRSVPEVSAPASAVEAADVSVPAEPEAGRKVLLRGATAGAGRVVNAPDVPSYSAPVREVSQ